MLADIEWYVILCAYLLDFFFADPGYICFRFLPHPIIIMGKTIEVFEDIFRRVLKNQFISGFVFALVLIFSTWMVSSIIINAADIVHPVLGILIKILLLFFCLSSKSLENAAMQVAGALEKDDLIQARTRVAMIVGRQVSKLDKAGVARAGCETVAENFVDGFLSPLFYALIGGVPFALTYKMINTLDSMTGYKNDRYLLFGRTAAKIDDAANYIPARLSVLIISMATAVFNFRRAKNAFKTGFKQGRLHKSPNAGFPEAAFAGALETRLGGPSWYHGKIVDKPFIGDKFSDPDFKKIKMACDLMMVAGFLSIVLSCFICLIF